MNSELVVFSQCLCLEVVGIAMHSELVFKLEGQIW